MRRRALLASQGGGKAINNYLTIEPLQNKLTASLSGSDCYYSIDGGEWTLLTKGDSTPSINIGQLLRFKRDDSTNALGTFSISKSFNLSGNCMSMLYGNKAANYNSVGNGAFESLFKSCKVVSVASEFLPATTLSYRCYYGMFMSCSSLVTAPRLPATVLAEQCYYTMFSRCSKLTTAPELPATTLANYCYASMFYGCSGLEDAPELPATTLANRCYQSMFEGCSELRRAPKLPATTLVTGCYTTMFASCTNLQYIKAMFTTTPSTSYTGQWVRYVSSTGTFVKNKNATWNVTGENGIPEGWTVKMDG